MTHPPIALASTLWGLTEDWICRGCFLLQMLQSQHSFGCGGCSSFGRFNARIHAEMLGDRRVLCNCNASIPHGHSWTIDVTSDTASSTAAHLDRFQLQCSNAGPPAMSLRRIGLARPVWRFPSVRAPFYLLSTFPVWRVLSAAACRPAGGPPEMRRRSRRRRPPGRAR